MSECAKCGHDKSDHTLSDALCVHMVTYLMDGDPPNHRRCMCPGFTPKPGAGAIPLDRLVNMTTIAAIMGVAKSTASTWQKRDVEFPKPLDTPGVAGIKLWDVRDIIAWRDSRVKAPVNVDASYVDKYRAASK